MAQNISLDVIRQFRLFYETLRKCQRSALLLLNEGPGDHETDKSENGSGAKIDTSSINQIVNDLINALEERGKDFSTVGGQYGSKLYQRVIYVFAAFADEMMLSEPWNGREQWRKNPLEVRLFGSQSSGEELFHDIDDELAAYEFGRQDLAKVYLMALNLGFQGRFRGTSSGDQIDRYKNKLFKLIYDRDASEKEAGKTFLGSVYRHNQTGGAPRLMPYLRPWLISLAVIAGLYIIGSHLIWDASTANLDLQIRDLTKQLSP